MQTSPISPPKKKNFRIQAKNFFLTFPSTETPKETALARILSSTLDPKGVLVAQESHADGSHHLHIGIFLNAKLHVRDPMYFDFICGKHGKYESMRDVSRTLAYLHKEDSQPLTWGDLVTQSTKPTKSTSDRVAQMIESGSSIHAVATAYPGFFLQNKRKIEDFAAFSSIKRMRESLKALRLPILYSGNQSVTAAIIDWLNSNLSSSRPFKSKQLYLYGPPDSRKTSLLLKVGEFFQIYDMPSEDFYDSFDENVHQLVVFDEFKGQKPLVFLNRWLQGDMFCIRRKGSQYIKTKNLPFIFCSNFSPTQAYRQSDASLDAFLVRLLIIEIIEPLDLDNVHWYFEERSSKEKEKDSVDEEDNQ